MTESTTLMNDEVYSSVWVLSNFDDWFICNFDNIQSCPFQVNNQKFSLELRFSHLCKRLDDIVMKPVLILEENDSNMPLSGYIRLSLLYRKYGCRKTVQREYMFDGFAKVCPLENDIKLRTLRNTNKKLLSRGNLILLCQITSCNKSLHGERNQNDSSMFFTQRQIFLLKTGQFSDFVVQVKDRKFPCHRFILECRSEYFAALFRHDMRENLENKLVLSDIEPDTFEQVLQYIYTGVVDALKDDIVALLAAADRFRLEGPTTSCENQLNSRLNIENAKKLYDIARIYNLQTLKMNAGLIGQYFGDEETSQNSPQTHAFNSDKRDSAESVNDSITELIALNDAGEVKFVEHESYSVEVMEFPMKLKITRTPSSSKRKLFLPDLWCITERVVLAKSVWSIENFTPDYFSNPETLISHIVTSNDGDWNVEIICNSPRSWPYFDLNLSLRIVGREGQDADLTMTFNILIFNEKREEIHIYCGKEEDLGSNRISSFLLLKDNRLTDEEMINGWEFRMRIIFTREKKTSYECPPPKFPKCDLAVRGNKFSDVVIKVREKEFLSHKAILAYHSPFIFSKLQENNSSPALIEIDEIEPDVFEKFLSSVYAGICALTEVEAKNLIPFANKYGFVDILTSLESPAS